MKLNFVKAISMTAAVAATLMFSACGDDSSSGVSDEVAENSSSSMAADDDSKTESSSSNSEAKSSSDKATENSSSDASENPADWHDYCLDVINKYRATENLKPLILAPEAKQTCVEEQAAADLKSNKAHGHFGDCGEFAQNSGPNIDLKWQNTEEKIVDTYLEMMWSEKELVESGKRDPKNDSDYPYIGHYLNMSSTKYTMVACGIAKSADGKTGWFNVNFH